MDFPIYVALSNYLEKGVYPRDCDQKNKTKIYRMAKKYMLDQGKLYLRMADGGVGQELLHEGNVTRVLAMAHSEGHMGINNTIRRMKKFIIPTSAAPTFTIKTHCYFIQ
ncbi:hypothetical protein BCR42DRAFT_494070 [Absidia repens]|uniref:Integrase zinc-binding domain-containing protein n=1 Tax=Absidia repens TaxID=90262 RepID=A0A1X2I8E8_9FUNG|nr:hypothetical protein BCR42DRAFT_494070 [Absidia repens]